MQTHQVTNSHTGFDLERAYKVLWRAFLRIEAAEEQSGTVQASQPDQDGTEHQVDTNTKTQPMADKAPIKKANPKKRRQNADIGVS